jgi:hypothetical protein
MEIIRVINYLENINKNHTSHLNHINKNPNHTIDILQCYQTYYNEIVYYINILKLKQNESNNQTK